MTASFVMALGANLGFFAAMCVCAATSSSFVPKAVKVFVRAGK